MLMVSVGDCSWSLITGKGGLQNKITAGGHVKFYQYKTKDNMAA